MVKEFLSQKGIRFQDIDVSRDFAAAQELVSRTGRSAVPVIIVDGQTIIGFDREQLEQALARAQERPTLGATIGDASKMAGSAVSGAYVANVRRDSPAEKLGLAPGDIITELNERPVGSAADLENALSGLSKGSEISLVFLRNGRRETARGILLWARAPGA